MLKQMVNSAWIKCFKIAAPLNMNFFYTQRLSWFKESLVKRILIGPVLFLVPAHLPYLKPYLTLPYLNQISILTFKEFSN